VSEDKHVGIKGGARGAQMFRRRVDQLLELLDGARQDKQFTRVPPRTFQGIDCTQYFGFHDDEALVDVDGLDDKGMPQHWPFDCSQLQDAPEWAGPGALAIWRARSVDPAAARGKARIISRFIIREDHLIVTKEAEQYRYAGGSLYYGLLGRRWIEVGLPTERQAWIGATGEGIPLRSKVGMATDQNVTERCNAFIGMAGLNHFQWFVEIGREDGFSFKFATIPEKAAAIFRLRDMPDGGARRRALRNWVSSHWRSDHRDPELERYVRQHLRGAEEFTWDGYFCRVTPSPNDIILNAQLAEERSVMGEQAVRRRFVAPDKPRMRVRAIHRYVGDAP